MRWNHVAITVSDMEKSLAFYRDALGLKTFMDEVASGPDLDKAIMEIGVRIRMVMLADEAMNMIELLEWQSHRAKKRPPEHLKFISTGLVEICLSVPDLEKLVEDLEKKGVKCRVPIWYFEAGGFGTKVTYVEDPDGVQVELVQI
jgi:catechol 2,3-dioxygenase-like lactoylglutathione lyase family enzyme